MPDIYFNYLVSIPSSLSVPATSLGKITTKTLQQTCPQQDHRKLPRKRIAFPVLSFDCLTLEFTDAGKCTNNTPLNVLPERKESSPAERVAISHYFPTHLVFLRNSSLPRDLY